jgi:predicted secreted hydrolase
VGVVSGCGAARTFESDAAEDSARDAGLTGDATAGCAPSAPAVCDGETVVACEGGVAVRKGCAEATFCNYGECIGTAVDLPGDAAPHDDAVEWWYYTGHLTTSSGRPYGFQVTIFQYIFPNNRFFMCHAAVTDEIGRTHTSIREMTEDAVSWRRNPVRLEVLNCRIEIDAAGDRIAARIPDEEDPDRVLYSLDLTLAKDKRVAMHGTDGVIPMGDTGNSSYYYSYTRTSASGLLTLPDRTTETASGIGWMDHQWGDFSMESFKGWDWYSMQADDGFEIMLFLFRDWNDVVVEKAGTILDPQAQATWIEGLDAFEITALSSWESPRTGGVYPLNWDITIPAMDWALRLETSVPDQEMDNPAKKYWEGSVTVKGTRGGAAVGGVGFVELTGYAGGGIFDPPRE